MAVIDVTGKVTVSNPLQPAKAEVQEEAEAEAVEKVTDLKDLQFWKMLEKVVQDPRAGNVMLSVKEGHPLKNEETDVTAPIVVGMTTVCKALQFKKTDVAEVTALKSLGNETDLKEKQLLNNEDIEVQFVKDAGNVTVLSDAQLRKVLPKFVIVPPAGSVTLSKEGQVLKVELKETGVEIVDGNVTSCKSVQLEKAELISVIAEQLFGNIADFKEEQPERILEAFPIWSPSGNLIASRLVHPANMLAAESNLVEADA